MKALWTLFVLLAASDIFSANALIDDVIEVLSLGKEILHTVNGAWEVVEATSDHADIDLPIVKQKEKEILSHLGDVSNGIHLLEDKVLNSASWTIESIQTFMTLNTKLELSLHELSGLMYRIVALEATMRDYIKFQDKLERTTLEDFATTTVSASSIATQGLLDRIHLLVTGSPDFLTFGSNGILPLIGVDLQQNKEMLCATKKSAQLILYQLYNAIALAELKGYVLMQFSWMLLRNYGKGNFTIESQLMKNRFDHRTNRTYALLRSVIKHADKSIWRCDPKVHVKDRTYVMFTGLMQGYVDNEVDLNNDHNCFQDCDYYQFTENFGCYHEEMLCARQAKCSGKILNCRFVDSKMHVCPAPKTSHRRYEYIEYEKGSTFGKHVNCTRGTTAVESWWRYLVYHCSYCFCHCDELSKQSDRFFNLRESVTNVTENRVVTGLRFVKKHRVIHLQIQDGKLLPRGHVNQSTTAWRPIHNYTIMDKGIKNGVDYHTVRWDKREIDLDDLMAGASQVVTGVRFRLVGGHLNLEIRVTEMNFAKGELDPNTSVWVSNDLTEVSVVPRTEVPLEKADVPTSPPANLPNSRTSQFVQFTHSDVELDAAQSTVPYFDAQAVVSSPVVPLSGAGLYHKGRMLSGGFVAPKLITYDYLPHIQKPKVEANSEKQ